MPTRATSRTPAGRPTPRAATSALGSARSDARGGAFQTTWSPRTNKVASRSVWTGTIAQTAKRRLHDARLFRIENGLRGALESVDWVGVYQNFGLLSKEVNDV